MKTTPRRRRSRRSLGSRLRTYWLLGLVVAGLTGWAVFTVLRLPYFHVRSLAVTGLARVSRDEVVARAAIAPDANAWLLDRTAIRRRLEAIPYVATALVHVRPPADVWLELTERTPEACVRDGAGRVTTVDAALRVLERGCAVNLTYAVRDRLDDPPGAFEADPELRVLQADARALEGRGDRYRRFAHDAFGELEATLDDGIDVRYGEDEDLGRKQSLVGPILAQLGARAGDVRAVDLRAPSTPVVEYRH